VISKKSTNKFTLLYTETCKNPYLSLHEYNVYIYQICIKIRKLKPLLLKKSIKNTQIDNMTSVKKSIDCTVPLLHFILYDFFFE
jgi:hypothetical protein